MPERVIVVAPRGYCAGVERAITSVELALEHFAPPVFVRRAIVHNAHVTARLAAAGAVFVDDLDEVPRGSVVVFGAHGVPACVQEQARSRELRVVDATCPLVAKVHREVRRYRRDGYDVLLVGHAGHDEVVGTLGQAPGARLVEDVAQIPGLQVACADRVACVTQTTLRREEVGAIVDALRERFPALITPPAEDVCYATRNRQAAVEWLARRVDVVLVVGDRSSSNSQRLCEAASALGCAAYLIEGPAALERAWLAGARVVGVTAGASTPSEPVRALIDELCLDGAVLQEEVVIEERMAFRLPAMDVLPATP